MKIPDLGTVRFALTEAADLIMFTLRDVFARAGEAIRGWRERRAAAREAAVHAASFAEQGVQAVDQAIVRDILLNGVNMDEVAANPGQPVRDWHARNGA